MDLPYPSAAVVEFAPAGCKPNVWANKDAWDWHRAQNSHLSAEKTLPEVVRIMEASTVSKQREVSFLRH